MPDLSIEELDHPAGVQRLTNNQILLGSQNEPIEKLRAMSPAVFEDVVLEWASDYLSTIYEKVYQIGGPGDKGRDIIAYTDYANKKSHYYQCKRYSAALAPADIYLELGKLCYYCWNSEIPLPEKYSFVATRGISPNSHDLITNPDTLGQQLVNNWNRICKSGITSTKQIDIDAEVGLKQFVLAFDFSIVDYKPELELLEEYRRTKWYPSRFGGGLVKSRGVIPKAEPEIQKHELNYIKQLFEAYSSKLGKEVDKDDLNADVELLSHFNDSRNTFYSAESLKVFSRDSLPDPQINPFDELTDEVYTMIIDTLRLDHENGYVRLLKSTSMAKSASYSSNALHGELKAQDKEGICHHLANENRIKWVR